jgi:protocatechuate 3,4-dioxygenase alpha subunit
MTMTDPGTTPSQTVGPFLSIGMEWFDDPYAVAKDTPNAFWIRGRLIDGAGEPVPDGVIETWQADPEGRFDHPDDPRGAVARTDGFRGLARSMTNADGEWGVFTVRPGALPAPGHRTEAPHLDVTVMARGMLNRVVTRIYFPGDEHNADDPALSTVDPDRRDTLLAAQSDDGYRFDIYLQGERETAFFAV